MNINYGQLNQKVDEDIEEIKYLRERDFLYEINKQYLYGVRPVKYRKTPKIEREISKEEVIKLVLDFYKQFDTAIYSKVKGIINSQDDISISIYEKDYKKKFPNEEHCKNTMLLTESKVIMLPKGECHIFDNAKHSIHVNLNGDVEDVYKLAHELSHSFDLKEESELASKNKTRNITTEVTPFVIENSLDKYLIDKGVITQKEALHRNAAIANDTRNNALENFVRFELAKLKIQNDYIDENILKQYLQNSNIRINEQNLQKLLNIIIRNKNSINYSTRYVTSNLLGAYMCENEKVDVEKFKEFLNKVKQDDFEGTFETIGIDIREDGIEKLIANRNAYNTSLQNHINKSMEEEISK